MGDGLVLRVLRGQWPEKIGNLFKLAHLGMAIGQEQDRVAVPGRGGHDPRALCQRLWDPASPLKRDRQVVADGRVVFPRERLPILGDGLVVPPEPGVDSPEVGADESGIGCLAQYPLI